MKPVWKGFDPDLLDTGYGKEIYAPKVRDSDRVIVELYAQLTEFFPHNSGSTGRYKTTVSQRAYANLALQAGPCLPCS